MSQRTGRSMQLELKGVTHWLIHYAACLAPESLSLRLEEEWLADSESRASALSRLRFAVGCCWATAVIVSEHPRTQVPVVSPATTLRGSITIADRNFGYVSLRSGTLFLIVGIHAALFCGVIATLSHAQAWETTRALQNGAQDSAPQVIEIADQ